MIVPDLKESIALQNKTITEGNALIEKTKNEVKKAKKTLEKLEKINSDYEKVLGDGLMIDEAAATIETHIENGKS